MERSGRRAASVAVQLNDERIHDNPIRVWELARGEQVMELRGHADGVRGLMFVGSGRPVSASQHGSVRVWGVDRGGPVAWLATHGAGSVIAAGSSGGGLQVLRLEGRVGSSRADH